MGVYQQKGKVEAEKKQMDNAQMTESRMLFTDIYESEIGKEDHTQEPDNSLDITEYTNTKDTVEEDNLDLTTTNTLDDITKIKLEVKDNAFVTANGKKILENTILSTDI